MYISFFIIFFYKRQRTVIIMFVAYLNLFNFWFQEVFDVVPIQSLPEEKQEKSVVNVENQNRIKNVISNTNNAVGAVLPSNRISTQSEELTNTQPATIGNYKPCFSFKISVTVNLTKFTITCYKVFQMTQICMACSLKVCITVLQNRISLIYVLISLFKLGFAWSVFCPLQKVRLKSIKYTIFYFVFTITFIM